MMERMIIIRRLPTFVDTTAGKLRFARNDNKRTSRLHPPAEPGAIYAAKRLKGNPDTPDNDIRERSGRVFCGN
ncbi:MAG: hypothetical protein ABII09_00990 [Planctomycetota bacterium]